MKIGVVGLGLIGGSFAKAFSSLDNTNVLGYDTDRNVVLHSKMTGAVKEELTKENIGECEYIFIALYPKATVDFLTENADNINKNTVVVDCGGIKRNICKSCFEIAKKHGFRFIGGHPMAGTHLSGFKFSRASMFDKASMVIVPMQNEKIETLESLKKLLVQIGFKSITITNSEEHDRIIAFTSQLAHVVSNAYVKSPNAKVHKGFSAGSYKDLTRVARLNPKMWTELFLENGDNLSNEIDGLITELKKYSDAIKNNDAQKLEQLLDEGSKLKESID